MPAKKTFQERQKELQSLLATVAGRAEIEKLAEAYAATSGKLRPARTSAVTYILVHEKEQGLIAG
jgi:hypothetical protein